MVDMIERNAKKRNVEYKQQVQVLNILLWFSRGYD